MRVLCVAEKPSISKSISQILSGGQFTTRATESRYTKNYEFNYPQTNSFYTVTSVSGHLNEREFAATHQKWNSCDPFELFDAEIVTMVISDNKAIEQNLRNQARRADLLMIWTDCDREGEHIGWEIASICKRAKNNIIVKRARFSAIIAQQIHRAAQHPVELDRAQVDAVEARIILDLRVGAAFTRMQTMSLQNRVGELQTRGVISYGPCQFPTLGFVVQRWKLVESFVSFPFWYIYLSLTRNAEAEAERKETAFTWKRGHIFSHEDAVSIYAFVMSSPLARVTKVVKSATKKWKPLPLTTVELQKAGSRLLRLAPKKILDIAEKLYQEGFLSYPRTETDQFDPEFDFQSLIQKQTADAAWGGFATSLTEGGFSVPRRGKNNDKAHPPIHPTAHAANLAGDEKKVYEYITRRFLACCSKDAEGWQTTIEVVCGEEFFSATGLVVLEKNYLLVFPYDKWTTHELPNFREGEEFHPSVCELREGKTSKPSLLTEADLVAEMDRNGIGTDATIATHIQTIIDRGYVVTRMEGATKYLMPSELGIGLIEGYNQIGLDKSLSKPQLRRETERRMVQVCDRIKTKADVLEETIAQYKEMFIVSKREFEKVITSVRDQLGRDGVRLNNTAGGDDGDDGGEGGGGRGEGRDGGQGGGRGGRGDGHGGSGRGNRGDGRGGRGRGNSSRRSETGGDGTRRGGRQGDKDRVVPSSFDKETGTSNNDHPLCDCGIPATPQTSGSIGKERKYWECGNNQTCAFYRRDTVTLGELAPPKRSYSLSRQNSNSRTDPLCRCSLPASRKTVTSEKSSNKGKRFWMCPKSNPGNPGCGYFEWEESQGSEAPTSSSQRLDDVSTNNKCFKCDQPGHWAANCPNDTNATKRPRGATKCLNCQEEGHLSAACPNNAQSRRPTGGSADDGCFKCGRAGHWSNACPGDGADPNVRGRGQVRGRRRGSTSRRATRGRGAKRRSLSTNS